MSPRSRYDVTIDADASEPQTNAAEVCVAEPLVDCAGDSVQVIPQSPAIEIVKTAGDAADGAVFATEPGTVTYTYVVTNTGSAGAPRHHGHRRQRDTRRRRRRLRGDLPGDDPRAGASMTCTSTVEVLVDTTNVAVVHGVTAEGNPAEASDDAVVDGPAPTA